MAAPQTKWDWGAAKLALESLADELTRDKVLAGALLSGVGRPLAEEMVGACVRLPPAPDAADSIAAVVAKDEAEAGTVTVRVGPRKSHPHSFVVRWIEKGTSKMPARPFMRPRYEEWRDQITPRFVEALRPYYKRAVARARRAA